MKKGWQVKKLGEECEIDKLQGVHRGLPYVGLEHIESQTARFIGETTPQMVKSSTFRFSTRHVLYGRLRPYLNKALAPDFEGHCSTEIFPLKPSASLSRDYLLYWLLADETRERINGTCTGARMPRANMKEVMGFDFPLPPLPEQKRIVAILDEAFAAIAAAKAAVEKNLQNARVLFESHLNEVFTRKGKGWVEKRLGDLINLQNGFAFKSKEYSESGYFVMRIGNVQNGKIDLSNPRYIQLTDKKLERFTLNQGDILASLTGNIGRVGIVNEEHLPAVLNQRVARITVRHKSVDHGFLFHFLSSVAFRERLQDAGHGAAQQNVSTKEIESVSICLPDNSTQKSIADHLDVLSAATTRLATHYARKLELLEELKKSLLHQAIAGEL